MCESIVKTISLPVENKFREKGSLFIGQAFPVSSAAEAEDILNLTRKKYHDATHNCYAYSLFDGTYKYSDAGEPSGTAGIRLYNAIQHFNLINILLISTRYFGGTKLGVGPLAKAYYKSGFEVLEISEIIDIGVYIKLELKFDFSLISSVHHILFSSEAVILDNDFNGKYILNCLVLKHKTAKLINHFEERLNNKIEISVGRDEILKKMQT